MPYRLRKAEVHARGKFLRKMTKYKVVVGHLHYSAGGERSYRILATTPVEAARKALDRPGVSTCGYREPFEDGPYDCTTFMISVFDPKEAE